MRADQLRGRKKVRLRSDRDLHRLAAHEIRVVIVVPRRNGVDDLIAGIDDRGIRGVDDRARSAGDQHRLDRISQRQLFFVEANHRAAQLHRAVGGRIVGLARAQRLDDVALQLRRNAKLGWREIADGQIEDLLPTRHRDANLARDLENLGACESARERGEVVGRRS